MKYVPHFFIIALLLVSGCTYHNEDDYFKDNPEICYVENRSYSEHIFPIIEANCIACHNANDATAGIVLEEHAQLINVIDQGAFPAVIKHEGGFTPMPLNQDKLSECEIEQIDAWIEQGMLNN